MKDDKEEIKNPPAFPKTGNITMDQGSEYDSIDQDGMTLRDYFAAKAMNKLIIKKDGNRRLVKNVAVSSYELADAMLKERSKKATS